MYAIIQTGSKQYKVEPNNEIDIEKVPLRPRAKTVSLDKVLLVADAERIEVGAPFLKNVSVKAEVIEPVIKTDKIVSFKYRSKKSSHWRKGHRQKLTRVKIKEISVS
ncbi:MAG: 50S ribosomal protein L21 [Candidatus Omnitrophota bacterium]